ncbi:hypothetical protein AWRI1631_142230 [Saccharomyces cerevisiae AWRI1631]|uniref:Uncharacterized protein n=1 Tax=Saccharomyces cerevisiae (strain AWRI1631) TaxID=545124 RepID=B5VQU8_YEAS6|nr:hypothetical protein AWRI1631_142230 [Saccharomyces cerevisiae AWRI1631]
MQIRNIVRNIMTLATPLLPSSSENTSPWSIDCKYAIGKSLIFGNIPPARIPPYHCLGTGRNSLTTYAKKNPEPNIRRADRQIIPTDLMSLSSILATILLNDRQGSKTVSTISEIILVASTVRIPILAIRKPTPIIK